MNQSESVAKLSAAFVKFQAALRPAIKDSANPYFKSKYADLAACWEAIREPLAANDLAIQQFPISTENGLGVETIILHASGEWRGSSFVLPFPVGKDGSIQVTPQAGASCITYARRYGLMAVTGLVTEDDDGNAAQATYQGRRPEPAPAAPPVRQQALAAFMAAAKRGKEAFGAAWKQATPQWREALTDLDIQSLKRECEHASSGSQAAD